MWPFTKQTPESGQLVLPPTQYVHCGLCETKVPVETLVDHWVEHAIYPLKPYLEADSIRTAHHEPAVFIIERPGLMIGEDGTLRLIKTFFMEAILRMNKDYPFLRFEYHVLAYNPNSGIIRSMMVIAKPY